MSRKGNLPSSSTSCVNSIDDSMVFNQMLVEKASSWSSLRAVQVSSIYRIAGTFGRCKFSFNGRKAFRIHFRILIFVCAHVGMPRPLVWHVHVYST